MEGYHVDQRYEAHSFTAENLTEVEFEACTFVNCNFLATDLTNTIFVNCAFKGCNFSEARIKNTAFREVRFEDCKMLGLRFDQCNTFLLEMAFAQCQLNLSSFFGLGLKNTVFSQCTLHEVEFVEADLTQVVFDQCDLHLASFEATKLNLADLSTATNYSFDPDKNEIQGAKFSLPDVVRLLDKYNIVIQ